MNKPLKLRHFKHLCMTIGNLPSSYIDSMSYYETLLWLIKFLKDEVIPTVNNNSEVVEELQEFVDHYFDNLDVQDEINNKLDSMSESGKLQEIIDEYLKIKTMIIFDTVQDMKESTNLIEGSYAKTLGYHAKTDNGGAIYKVKTITNADVIDESLIIALNDNTLVAELVVEEVNVMQFGAYGNSTDDDTVYFQKAIAYALKKSNDLNIQVPVIVPNNVYKITDTITVPILQVDLVGEEAEIQTYIAESEKPVFHLIGEKLTGSIRKIEGFTFRNKTNNLTDSVLFFVGSTTYTEGKTTDVGAQFNINKCYFIKYGCAVLTGDNSYLFNLNECNSGDCYNVLRTKYAFNTGENISINRCILTGFTVCLDVRFPNIQINCNDTSFDAGQQVLSMLSSASTYKGNLINFNNCHFEPTVLDVPLMKMVSGDISRINITKCTSFINTNLDYIFELTNQNQLLSLENNFFTFGSKPPKYLCNSTNIYCKGNEYSLNIPKNTSDNLFVNKTLNSTNISNNLITQSGETINTDKFYIFRDNTSYNTGLNRITSNNCNLTLDSNVKPEGMTKSIKVTATGVADLIVCAMCQYKGQDQLKGSIKIMFPETLTGTLIINFACWDGLTTKVFVNNFRQLIDLSTITPNQWIEIPVPTQSFHSLPEGKYWGFHFALQGVNKPPVPYTYYIAEPNVQSI